MVRHYDIDDMESTCCNDNGIQWTIGAEDTFQTCGATTPRLPAGGYSCSTDCYGKPVLARRRLESDNLLQVEGNVASEVVEEIRRFWTLRSRYRDLGFLHRRGYLFYGKQGGGKSSLVHQIVLDVIADDGVAFYCEHPHHFANALVQFRKVEPQRPIVCVFEDIEAIIEDHGDNLLLQWLDGNHQVDRAVNLATTNYPEQLDRRIISRPRRFDRILRVDSPGEALRRAYLERKLPEQSPDTRGRWVEETDGFTFAALSELIIAVECLGDDFDETLLRIRQLDVHEPSSLEFAGTE